MIMIFFRTVEFFLSCVGNTLSQIFMFLVHVFNEKQYHAFKFAVVYNPHTATKTKVWLFRSHKKSVIGIFHKNV